MDPQWAGLSPRRRGNHAGRRLQADSGGPIPAGGGTRGITRAANDDLGLSPRKRGNLERLRAGGLRNGPIPAQAGEPCARPGRSVCAWAYPRAGGGTRGLPFAAELAEGLSPRRRGNQPMRAQGPYSGGPIPAQAGEPMAGAGCSTTPRAYPRAGGGTALGSFCTITTRGLSPRRRGNRKPVRRRQQQSGPIPAQAGNRWRERLPVARRGPIPAQAGEPPSCPE